MMNRRKFFGWIAKAAIAANLEFGSLVPILVPPEFVEKWWYQVEINDHVKRFGQFAVYSRRIWLEEPELAKYGLKHEDFADVGDAVSTLNDPRYLAVAETEPMGERFFRYDYTHPVSGVAKLSPW